MQDTSSLMLALWGTTPFFRSSLLKAGAQDRVFGLIANELSFLHDYYYSSLPISYSKCCLPILSIFLSLLTIGWCILFLVLAMGDLFSGPEDFWSDDQLECKIWCIDQHLVSEESSTHVGRRYLDWVPLILLHLKYCCHLPITVLRIPGDLVPRAAS